MQKEKYMLKKFESLLVALGIILTVVSPTLVKADDVAVNNNVKESKNDLSYEIQNSVRVIQKYDNSVKVSIVDSPQLRDALKSNNVSYEKLSNMVDQVNQYFEKNKNNISPSLAYLYVNKTKKTSKHGKKASTHKKKKNNSGICSKALKFIGFVHSKAYSLAAKMLGLTGPESVIIPILVGLVYQAGALFC